MVILESNSLLIFKWLEILQCGALVCITDKEVRLHAPITRNTFQFKHKKMTCFYGHHFSCLEGI